MKYCFVIIGMFCFATSCMQPVKQTVAEVKPLNMDSMKMVLMNTDLAFSDLSLQKGTHEAFMTYVADNGTLLRPYHLPITGKDSVHAYLFAKPDTTFTLTWKPLYADIAASGDLGYTFGTYQFTVKNSKESEAGTYVSIWKQDAAGNWKYVLDTGNPGLQPDKQVTN